MTVSSVTLGRIGLLWCALFLAGCGPKPKPVEVWLVGCDFWQAGDGSIMRRCEFSDGHFTFDAPKSIRAFAVREQ